MSGQPQRPAWDAQSRVAAQPVDREQCELLGSVIGAAVRAHLQLGRGHDGVLEVLNVLAGLAAHMLAGTGNDPQARAFFDAALEQQLRDLQIGEVQGHG